MSDEATTLPVVDAPPEVWVDPEEFELTDAEVADGNRLGVMIDTDDDEDNGHAGHAG